MYLAEKLTLRELVLRPILLEFPIAVSWLCEAFHCVSMNHSFSFASPGNSNPCALVCSVDMEDRMDYQGLQGHTLLSAFDRGHTLGKNE